MNPVIFIAPAILESRGVSLRSAVPEDQDFLRDLYVSHRWEEMQSLSDWDEAQRLAFLRDQAALQARHYATHYYDAEFLVIEAEGSPIGRLYLFHNHPQDLRIVEIGFVPAWRGRGLGTILLKAVQDLARDQGKFCSIHVEHTNPARSLYRRLGFQEVKLEGPYILLEWRAA